MRYCSADGFSRLDSHQVHSWIRTVSSPCSNPEESWPYNSCVFTSRNSVRGIPQSGPGWLRTTNPSHSRSTYAGTLQFQTRIYGIHLVCSPGGRRSCIASLCWIAFEVISECNRQVEYFEAKIFTCSFDATTSSFDSLVNGLVFLFPFAPALELSCLICNLLRHNRVSFLSVRATTVLEQSSSPFKVALLSSTTYTHGPALPVM